MGIISLNGLLKHQNPLLKEYIEGELIEDYRRWSPERDYINYSTSSGISVFEDLDKRDLYGLKNKKIQERISKAISYFEVKLNNEVLVDLGSGNNNFKEIAEQLGVGCYICVDLRHPKGIQPDLYTNLGEDTSENMQQIKVKADMLDFVSHLKTNSVNFVINAIDNYVVPNGEWGNKYNHALLEEIVRSTKQGGLIFGANSTVIGSDQIGYESKKIAKTVELERRKDVEEMLSNINDNFITWFTIFERK